MIKLTNIIDLYDMTGKFLNKLKNLSIPTWSWLLACFMTGFLVSNEGSLAPRPHLLPGTEPVRIAS